MRFLNELRKISSHERGLTYEQLKDLMIIEAKKGKFFIVLQYKDVSKHVVHEFEQNGFVTDFDVNSNGEYYKWTISWDHRIHS